MAFKAFLRTQFLTVTGLTQILSFCSNFYPNLPSKDSRNKKELSGHSNQSNPRLYILLFSMKTIINVCPIWAFLGTNGLMVKNQVVTA